MKTRATICFFSAGTIALSSCSTAYTPRPSPRIAVTMQGGTPAYARNGKIYEGGPFGGDLDEAVRGNAEAEAHASAYQSGMIGGFVSTLLGSAALVGGATLVVANSSRGDQAASSDGQTAGAALMLGGVAAYIVGVVLVSKAQPHFFDAINVYNDGVAPAPGPPGMPGPEPTIAPTAAPSPTPSGTGTPLPAMPNDTKKE